MEEQGRLQGRRVHAAEEAGRGSRPAAPGQDRREADQAQCEAGGIPGSPGGRSVQAGSLPVLGVSSQKSEVHRARPVEPRSVVGDPENRTAAGGDARRFAILIVTVAKHQIPVLEH